MAQLSTPTTSSSKTIIDSDGLHAQESQMTPPINSLFIKVEDAVFCVNRNVFVEDSEVFSELFEMPHEQHKPVEGTSASHPIVLENVKKDEMELFLSAMFPRHIMATRTITDDQWMIVLKLLMMWRFKDGKAAVIRHLAEKASWINKIRLWSLYSREPEFYHEQWLLPSVIYFARRPRALIEEEANALGLDHVWKIFRVRETFRCSCSRPCIEVYKCPRRSSFDFLSAICKEYNVVEPDEDEFYFLFKA